MKKYKLVNKKFEYGLSIEYVQKLREFKLVDKINISDWKIINPSFMIYKGEK